MTTLTPPAADPAVPAAADGFDVLDVTHERIHVALGQLAALIKRIEASGADAEAQALARQVLELFSTTVRQHHADEERHVFPPLLAGTDPEVVQAVLRLQQDHNWLEEDWMELQPLLGAIAGGQSFGDLPALQSVAEVFTALLNDHIALEESLIYPLARQRSQGQQRLQMGREMAARRRGRTSAG